MDATCPAQEEEQVAASSDNMSSSDNLGAVPVVTNSGLRDDFCNLKRLIDALPDSAEKRVVESQMAVIDAKISLPSRRDEKVRKMILGRIFDPKSPFTEDHFEEAADLLSSTSDATLPAGGSVSATVVKHLADLLRSTELKHREAHPIYHSVLFKRWCALLSGLPAEAIVTMMCSGVLRQLFAVDMQLMARWRIQFEKDHEAAGKIALCARDALCAMPHLGSLCTLLEQRGDAAGVPVVVKFLDNLMKGLNKALQAQRRRAKDQPAMTSSDATQTAAARKELGAAFDRVEKGGGWLQLAGDLQSSLERAKTHGNPYAVRVVGEGVTMLLERTTAEARSLFDGEESKLLGAAVEGDGGKKRKNPCDSQE